MRLPGRRRAAATLALGTSEPLRAREELRATLTLPAALDGVDAARVELAYVNTYRYRWAGRRDAAMAFDDSSLVTMGEVGTSYGSDRATSDRVHVLDVALPVAGGMLEAGEHAVTLRIPSWAPGSSSVVEWEARAVVERSGRDVDETVPLTVLVAAPDPEPAELELIQGERVLANDLLFDVRTERACHKPGETVSGVVTITPGRTFTREAKLGIRFSRELISHPLERAPGDTTYSETRPTTNVATGLTLTEGVVLEVPFAVALPEDADPTTEAVHSSVRWWVLAEVEESGMTGAIERARREIVLHTA